MLAAQMKLAHIIFSTFILLCVGALPAHVSVSRRPEGSVRPTGPGGGGGCRAGKAARALTTEPSPHLLTQSLLSHSQLKSTALSLSIYLCTAECAQIPPDWLYSPRLQMQKSTDFTSSTLYFFTACLNNQIPISWTFTIISFLGRHAINAPHHLPASWRLFRGPSSFHQCPEKGSRCELYAFKQCPLQDSTHDNLCKLRDSQDWTQFNSQIQVLVSIIINGI